LFVVASFFTRITAAQMYYVYMRLAAL